MPFTTSPSCPLGLCHRFSASLARHQLQPVRLQGGIVDCSTYTEDSESKCSHLGRAVCDGGFGVKRMAVAFGTVLLAAFPSALLAPARNPRQVSWHPAQHCLSGSRPNRGKPEEHTGPVTLLQSPSSVACRSKGWSWKHPSSRCAFFRTLTVPCAVWGRGLASCQTPCMALLTSHPASSKTG